jgi:hypothetical protein
MAVTLLQTIITMKFLPIILFFILLLTACTHQSSKPTSGQQVYQILFEGKMVGRLVQEESRLKGIIRNKEILELKTRFRGMDSIISRIVEIHEESPNGKIKRYQKNYQTPNAERQLSGEIIDGQWHWKETRGDQLEQLIVTVPDDFFLHHQLQQLMQIQLQKQQGLTYHGWNEDLRQFEKIRLDTVEHNAQKNQWKILQTYPELPQKKPSSYWVNKHFQLVESSISYRGFVLPITVCHLDCETEQLFALSPLDQQMIASPYKITNAALNGHIRYQLIADSSLNIPSTPEQKVQNNESAWRIDVCASCIPAIEKSTPNLSRFLTDNHWLDIHNTSLVAAVKGAVNDGMSVDKKMQKLLQLTRRRLENNLQFQGYASASQAYKNRSGDCTEYALLLASFGRIANIPTRVVMGLSYSRESFHGKRNMFAPHAWVQAWIDGQWKSYDAAMGQFDAGHIALKISDGKKQDFSEMAKQLERINIISLQQIVQRKHLGTATLK